jgi:hypothetical protein
MKRMLLLFSLVFPLSFYGQNDTADAGKAAKIGIVSADKMNVVYRGLANPVSIYLPNSIPFIASAPGLSKDEKGNYTLIPGAGTEVVVSVVYQKNGKYVAEKHKFKILGIPPLNIAIDERYYALCPNCIYEFSKNELKDVSLTVETNRDFPDDIPVKILGMGFIFPDEKYIRISGNKVTGEAFTEIDKLKKGETVSIKFSLDTNAASVNPLKILIKE